MRDTTPQATTSRRRFLSRATIMAAMSAALVGGAEVAGLSPALAKGQHRGRTLISNAPLPQHKCQCLCNCTCLYSPGYCNGGKPCPNGKCCYDCDCCGSYAFACFSNHCHSNFTYCKLYGC